MMKKFNLCIIAILVLFISFLNVNAITFKEDQIFHKNPSVNKTDEAAVRYNYKFTSKVCIPKTTTTYDDIDKLVEEQREKCTNSCSSTSESNLLFDFEKKVAKPNCNLKYKDYHKSDKQAKINLCIGDEKAIYKKTAEYKNNLRNKTNACISDKCSTTTDLKNEIVNNCDSRYFYEGSTTNYSSYPYELYKHTMYDDDKTDEYDVYCIDGNRISVNGDDEDYYLTEINAQEKTRLALISVANAEGSYFAKVIAARAIVSLDPSIRSSESEDEWEKSYIYANFNTAINWISQDESIMKKYFNNKDITKEDIPSTIQYTEYNEKNVLESGEITNEAYKLFMDAVKYANGSSSKDEPTVSISNITESKGVEGINDQDYQLTRILKFDVSLRNFSNNDSSDAAIAVNFTTEENANFELASFKIKRSGDKDYVCVISTNLNECPRVLSDGTVHIKDFIKDNKGLNGNYEVEVKVSSSANSTKPIPFNLNINVNYRDELLKDAYLLVKLDTVNNQRFLIGGNGSNRNVSKSAPFKWNPVQYCANPTSEIINKVNVALTRQYINSCCKGSTPVITTLCESKGNIPGGVQWCNLQTEMCEYCDPKLDMNIACTEFTDADVITVEDESIGYLSDPNDVAICVLDYYSSKDSTEENGDKPSYISGTSNTYTEGQDVMLSNPYRVTRFNDNPYCDIFCKENIEINLPKAKYVNSGQYFSIQTLVKGTQTCYTSKVDYDLFIKDLNGSDPETAKRYINECYNVGDIDYNFNPDIKFDYDDENYFKNDKIKDFEYGSEISKSVKGSPEACYGEISNNYNCKSTSAVSANNGAGYPSKFYYSKRTNNVTKLYYPLDKIYIKDTSGIIDIVSAKDKNTYKDYYAKLTVDIEDIYKAYFDEEDYRDKAISGVPISLNDTTIKKDANGKNYYGVYNFYLTFSNFGQIYNRTSFTTKVESAAGRLDNEFVKVYSDETLKTGIPASYVCSYIPNYDSNSKHVCETPDQSSDGKYHCKNGDVCDKDKYTIECDKGGGNSDYCKIHYVDGDPKKGIDYYTGLDGRRVSRDVYLEECDKGGGNSDYCKIHYVGGDPKKGIDYYTGLDGRRVSRDVYLEECDCPHCPTTTFEIPDKPGKPGNPNVPNTNTSTPECFPNCPVSSTGAIYDVNDGALYSFHSISLINFTSDGRAFGANFDDVKGRYTVALITGDNSSYPEINNEKGGKGESIYESPEFEFKLTPKTLQAIKKYNDENASYQNNSLKCETLKIKDQVNNKSYQVCSSELFEDIEDLKSQKANTEFVSWYQSNYCKNNNNCKNTNTGPAWK